MLTRVDTHSDTPASVAICLQDLSLVLIND
jgi:hypothetical protein